MSFAVQDYLGPMLDFFVFTLYQHSFNIKELAPDLQQRKTRLSDLELELKNKERTFQAICFLSLEVQALRCLFRITPKMPQFILKIV